MPFYSYDDVIRISQLIQEMPCEVSEELRGWRWREPPLLPTYNLLINASDLGFECKTGRLAFLRHHLRVKESSVDALRFGSFVHKVIALATAKAKAILYYNRPRNGVDFFKKMMDFLDVLKRRRLSRKYEATLDTIWRRAALTYSSSLDRVMELSKHLSLDGIVNRVVPWICEFPIDGRVIGLSRAIRIDALVPPALIVEFKTRPPKRSFEVALAGYALCFENQYRIPVNHAIMLYLDFSDGRESLKVYEKILRLDDQLRLEFIERRDLYASKAADGIDPGLPDECDPYCPYLGVCRREG